MVRRSTDTAYFPIFLISLPDFCSQKTSLGRRTQTGIVNPAVLTADVELHMTKQSIGKWTALLAGVVLLGLAVGVSQESIMPNGQWLIEAKPDNDRVQLTLRYSSKDGYFDNGWWGSTSGSRLPVSALQGLAAAQMFSNGSQVSFRIVRDAGSFPCEGWFKDGQGSGHFSFEPSPQFAA
jgi:hypothetical protein